MSNSVKPQQIRSQLKIFHNSLIFIDRKSNLNFVTIDSKTKTGTLNGHSVWYWSVILFISISIFCPVWVPIIRQYDKRKCNSVNVKSVLTDTITELCCNLSMIKLFIGVSIPGFYLMSDNTSEGFVVLKVSGITLKVIVLTCCQHNIWVPCKLSDPPPN